MLLRSICLSGGDVFGNFSDGYSLLLHAPKYQTLTLYCPDGTTVKQM